MKEIVDICSHIYELVFSRGWGFCLDDVPQKKGLKSKVIAPGVIYDVHHQCQLQYGPNATFCQEVEVSLGILAPLVGMCRAWGLQRAEGRAREIFRNLKTHRNGNCSWQGV